MKLFRSHFSINAVGSVGVVHLMWWGQSPSQIFFSFHCWYSSAVFPKTYLSKMVDFLKHSWGAFAPRNPGYYVNFLFSPRPSGLCMHGPFNHPRVFDCPRVWPITKKRAQITCPHNNNNNNNNYYYYYYYYFMLIINDPLNKRFCKKAFGFSISLFKKCYVYNIFVTLLQQILCGKLLLVLIWTYHLNYFFAHQ